MEIYIQQCQTNSANPLMEPTLDTKMVQISKDLNNKRLCQIAQPLDGGILVNDSL